MKRVDQLLVMLGEEAAEVAQETSKCLRFGPTEVYAAAGISNAERVIREFNDLYALMEILQSEGVFPEGFLNRRLIADKKIKVEEMLEYSRKVGRLE